MCGFVAFSGLFCPLCRRQRGVWRAAAVWDGYAAYRVALQHFLPVEGRFGFSRQLVGGFANAFRCLNLRLHSLHLPVQRLLVCGQAGQLRIPALGRDPLAVVLQVGKVACGSFIQGLFRAMLCTRLCMFAVCLLYTSDAADE